MQLRFAVQLDIALGCGCDTRGRRVRHDPRAPEVSAPSEQRDDADWRQAAAGACHAAGGVVTGARRGGAEAGARGGRGGTWGLPGRTVAGSGSVRTLVICPLALWGSRRSAIAFSSDVMRACRFMNCSL